MSAPVVANASLIASKVRQLKGTYAALYLILIESDVEHLAAVAGNISGDELVGMAEHIQTGLRVLICAEC